MKKEIEKLLNSQVEKEGFSANLYLSMVERHFAISVKFD